MAKTRHNFPVLPAPKNDFGGLVSWANAITQTIQSYFQRDPFKTLYPVTTGQASGTVLTWTVNNGASANTSLYSYVVRTEGEKLLHAINASVELSASAVAFQPLEASLNIALFRNNVLISGESPVFVEHNENDRQVVKFANMIYDTATAGIGQYTLRVAVNNFGYSSGKFKAMNGRTAVFEVAQDH